MIEGRFAAIGCRSTTTPSQPSRTAAIGFSLIPNAGRMQTMAKLTKHELRADKAMREIWAEWFTFYQAHFRSNGVAISAADQMAFYEIAQPKMFALVSARPANDREEHNSAARDMRERCAKVAETAARPGKRWLALVQTMAGSEAMRQVIVEDIRAAPLFPQKLGEAP